MKIDQQLMQLRRQLDGLLRAVRTNNNDVPESTVRGETRADSSE